MTLRLVSLCSGIDGLALGIEAALGAVTVAQAEIDPHASVVLAHRWPDAPNLGDLRTADWASLGPVDVMCFGFPCQDISQAGRRAGLKGDKSVLWFDCADAVRLVRPRYLLVENVSALLVRGFDVVQADLAQMGYVGRWGCLRSSQVGAPHRRERVFIAAAFADPERGQDSQPDGHDSVRGRPGDTEQARLGSGTPADAGSAGTGRHAGAVPRPATERGRPGTGLRSAFDGDPAPADASSEGRQGGQAGRSKPPRTATPDTTPSGHEDQQDSSDPSRFPLSTVAGAGHRNSGGDSPEGIHELGRAARIVETWGPYAFAVRRWERILGRPAPNPRDNRGRLNPELAEWMLGYPHGWVTDPMLGLPRTAQRRVLGNSVQPQVAELAARTLLLPLLQALETAA